MRYFLFIILLSATQLDAQSILSFDKRFIECEDRWVAFEKNKDSAHVYGFIYIDAEAGLTFNYEGTFTISSVGEFIPEKIDAASYKVRLQPNDVLVALIPENKFKELKIAATPDWLANYKRDTNSVDRLYRWGFMYNGWEMCAKALTYLERAQKIDSKYKGLLVEMSFSYNCLGQYNQAASVLKNALEENPTDAYSNKELIYSLIKSGQLDKASESCKNAIAICTDTTYHAENCYNLLHEYFIKKDKANFTKWLEETRKWNAGKDKYMKSIAAMETQLNQ